MQYALSDLHGCYDLYLKALTAINFNENDTLYVVGDVCDRGPKPMQILLDMQKKPNIIPLLGNHDYFALNMLKKVMFAKENNKKPFLPENDLLSLYYWLNDGGRSTYDGFCNLSKIEQNRIISYLESFKRYEQIIVNNQKYLLVHAGLGNFEIKKSLTKYTDEELLFDRLDYHQKYFDDQIIVTGHTPTILIDQSYKNKIYINNNNIGLDCGAVFFNTLGIYCFDNQKCYYVTQKTL